MASAYCWSASMLMPKIASDAARELANNLGWQLLAALKQPPTEAQRGRFEADFKKYLSDSEDT
jgi:hypothetical protein